jgi:Bacterial DNA-binding protein
MVGVLQKCRITQRCRASAVRAARMGRNPATGEAIKIKAGKKVA